MLLTPDFLLLTSVSGLLLLTLTLTFYFWLLPGDRLLISSFLWYPALDLLQLVTSDSWPTYYSTDSTPDLLLLSSSSWPHTPLDIPLLTSYWWHPIPALLLLISHSWLHIGDILILSSSFCYSPLDLILVTSILLPSLPHWHTHTHYTLLTHSTYTSTVHTNIYTVLTAVIQASGALCPPTSSCLAYWQCRLTSTLYCSSHGLKGVFKMCLVFPELFGRFYPVEVI